MRYMSVLPAYNSRFHCRLCSKNASRVENTVKLTQ